MADTPFPAFTMPRLVSERAASTTVPFRKSPAFDFAAGDIVLDGAGRAVVIDGKAAWVQWCTQALMVERYSALVYSRGYGVELEHLSGASRERIQAEVERTITQALMVDRRTRSVSGFSFTWSGDQLTVSCTATPAVGSSEVLTVNING